MAIQQINLFNPDFVPRLDLATARYGGGALAIALALAVVAAGAASYLAADLSAQAHRIAQESDALRATTDSLAVQLSARKPDATLERQLAERREVIRARTEVARWLRADGGGETRGVSEYYRALARRTLEGVWLTGFAMDADRGQLRIEGRALKGDLVPQYLTQLGEEALLKGRAFAKVELGGETTGRSQDPGGEGLPFRLETAVDGKGREP